MTKEDVLQAAINEGNEYEFISWDGLLDICDEDMKLVNYLEKQLIKLKGEGKINFELDF
jgi:hypothetical protein